MMPGGIRFVVQVYDRFCGKHLTVYGRTILTQGSNREWNPQPHLQASDGQAGGYTGNR
jgi:hypothetical protein